MAILLACDDQAKGSDSVQLTTPCSSSKPTGSRDPADRNSACESSGATARASFPGPPGSHESAAPLFRPAPEPTCQRPTRSGSAGALCRGISAHGVPAAPRAQARAGPATASVVAWMFAQRRAGHSGPRYHGSLLTSDTRGRIVTSPALPCVAFTPTVGCGGARASPGDHPRRGKPGDAWPGRVPRPRSPGRVLSRPKTRYRSRANWSLCRGPRGPGCSALPCSGGWSLLPSRWCWWWLRPASVRPSSSRNGPRPRACRLPGCPAMSPAGTRPGSGPGSPPASPGGGPPWAATRR